MKIFSFELQLSHTQPQIKIFLLRMSEILFSWFLDILNVQTVFSVFIYSGHNLIVIAAIKKLLLKTSICVTYI